MPEVHSNGIGHGEDYVKAIFIDKSNLGHDFAPLETGITSKET